MTVEAVFRSEYGRAVAVLVRAFGDIDLAEESVQDAFAEAVRRWPVDGEPPSPAGWIITTARRKALDRLRREATRAGREARAAPSRSATTSRRRWASWRTTGCGSSSPAATRRSRRPPGWR